jgi:hypothetical protein
MFLWDQLCDGKISGNLYLDGFRVVKFPKQDVMNNIDKVIAVFRASLDLPGNRKTSPEGTSGEAGGGNEKSETNTNS